MLIKYLISSGSIIMKNKYEYKPEYDYLLPIHIIGYQHSGKSQLLNRFAYNDYMESYFITIGFDFRVKTLNVQDKRVKLQVWDNPSSTTNKVVPAKAFIVVYDCTDMQSFIEAKKLVNKLQSEHSDKPVTLVATKSDLICKKVIEYETAKEFADSKDLNFFEVSAKENSNVNDVFIALSLQLMESIEYQEKKSGHLNPGQKTPAAISNNSDDEKFRKKLEAYITKRNNEFTNTGKQYHWGARLFIWFQNKNISANNKIVTAEKALNLLYSNDAEPQKNKSNSATFTMDEITTLSNGRLGTIMKEKLKSMKHTNENGEIRYFFDNSNGSKNH